MVDYIKYKGESYPVRFAWSTIKAIQSVKDLTEFELTELALYYGLLSGHNAVNKEMTIPIEEMQFILDESIDEFKRIYKKQVDKKDSDTTDNDETKKNTQ